MIHINVDKNRMSTNISLHAEFASEKAVIWVDGTCDCFQVGFVQVFLIDDILESMDHWRVIPLVRAGSLRNEPLVWLDLRL